MSLLRRRLDCVYTNKNFYAEGPKRPRRNDSADEEPGTDDTDEDVRDWIKIDGVWYKRERQPPK